MVWPTAGTATGPLSFTLWSNTLTVRRSSSQHPPVIVHLTSSSLHAAARPVSTASSLYQSDPALAFQLSAAAPDSFFVHHASPNAHGVLISHPSRRF